jgi:hypothetical protein
LRQRRDGGLDLALAQGESLSAHQGQRRVDPLARRDGQGRRRLPRQGHAIAPQQAPAQADGLQPQAADLGHVTFTLS